MKMLVSDYDNTFYVNDEDILNNMKYINHFMNNNIFVIATGRSYYDFNKVKKLYNINCNYTIINHGATILKQNEIIYNKEINNNIIKEILKDLKKYEIVDSFACSRLESRLDLEKDKSLTKIYVKYNTEKEAKDIQKIILDKYSNYLNVFLSFKNKVVEIVSNEVDKSNAIKFIANIENISRSDIYTIGDGYNDIKMIKDFNGYTITNAVEEIKKYAISECESVSDLIKQID